MSQEPLKPPQIRRDLKPPLHAEPGVPKLLLLEELLIPMRHTKSKSNMKEKTSITST